MPDAEAPKPPRRPRYRGTHPRRFEQRYKEKDPVRFPQMQDHIRAQGRTPAGSHVPVMLAETIDLLALAPGEVVVDATLGRGGHASAILDAIGPTGRLIGVDHDQAELDRTRERFRRERPGAPVTLVHSHFAGLGKIQAEHAPEGFDAVLADLGVSSMQIDDPARGFSYKFDGPLDMRMDRRSKVTAKDIVARLSEEELSELLRRHGDEPEHVRIAKKIVERRAIEPFTRTRQLAYAILRALKMTPDEWTEHAKANPGVRHPAARTFQALRIVVNDEIGQLEHLLRTVPWCLKPGGRVVILSFHSGEDGRVAESFESGLTDGTWSEITTEAIRPLVQERRDNPRAASARLRRAIKA